MLSQPHQSPIPSFSPFPRGVRPLGIGVDERVLEAVRLYRFRLARKDGKPVAVRVSVAVNFRLS
jgi:Gram-negative bacterial TonB protein C-terminal